MNNRKFDERPELKRRKLINELYYPVVDEYETIVAGQKVKVKVYKTKTKEDCEGEDE